MSNQNPLVICKDQIAQAAVKFTSSDLSFQAEEVFAMQQLMKNDYLLTTAVNDPDSLRLAMYNVAAIGISLNPVRQLAYLIPRADKKGTPPKVKLDISYRGLIALGQAEGVIANAVCELVYKQDSYLFKGPTRIPDHDANVFSTDRGEVIGGYCITELINGKVQIHNMSKADMDQIRDASQAYNSNSGPWLEWESQMQLKSILKRAAKWWPASSPKMAKVIEFLNVENGEGFVPKAVSNANQAAITAPAKEEDVDSRTLSFINQALTRAVQSQSFEACKELMENRIKDPAYLAFALARLQEVQPEEADYREVG
ncbi:recombinase RecT [Zhongshania marina]|uniref:Recombinase RecT n=1 Tax=Zhongshania marina TaxID=2304603 RepID=A0A2S4HC48_9GAMM|nr:recombinase RecT [Marortus luteolus]POP51509.1 recombinase RecT [Marortus luteolus]